MGRAAVRFGVGHVRTLPYALYQPMSCGTRAHTTAAVCVRRVRWPQRRFLRRRGKVCVLWRFGQACRRLVFGPQGIDFHDGVVEKLVRQVQAGSAAVQFVWDDSPMHDTTVMVQAPRGSYGLASTVQAHWAGLYRLAWLGTEQVMHASVTPKGTAWPLGFALQDPAF